MIASVILAHPYEKSFNHAIYKTVIETMEKNDIGVYHHDLYAEKFNPILTKGELGSDRSYDEMVNTYAQEMLSSDILAFIHPNWWGQPPAILKGYIDRIFRPPYAYDFPVGDSGGGLPEILLETKVGMVFNTSNTNDQREKEYFGDPLENIWAKCVFGFLGIEHTHRRTFSIVADSSQEDRDNWLATVKQDVITHTMETSLL